jgi:hypothetical protein
MSTRLTKDHEPQIFTCSGQGLDTRQNWLQQQSIHADNLPRIEEAEEKLSQVA